MILTHKLSWQERLWRILCPNRCLGCFRVLPPEQLFCKACQKELPGEPISRDFLLPPDGEGRPWGQGRLSVLSPLSYRGSFRTTLYRMKFQGESSLAQPLGWVMADAAKSFHRSFQGVAYVPMSPAKLKRRGYNQSALLAKWVARELRLPCLDLLEQCRETETQHGLARAQRSDNVRGAYQGLDAAEGKDLLLVDDVVTTGATLRSCAVALYQAGARSVWGLCAMDAGGEDVQAPFHLEEEEWSMFRKGGTTRDPSIF